MDQLVVKLKIVRELPNLKPMLPKYATPGSAAIDLAALIAEPLNIKAGMQELIPTGIAMYIGNPNYAGLILPRSGLSVKHGIVLANLSGLIDSDYQGELLVATWNRSDKDYIIQPGERIAQLIIIPITHPRYEVCTDFAHVTDRASGGFGHTGKTYVASE